MTCRRSFWTNLKVNIKRRVWVWVLSVFMILIAYPGFITISFSQIDKYYEYGNYRTTVVYYDALKSAVLETLSGGSVTFIIMILAIVMALQGYSYLFSKKKVDMYHSVPVTMKSRFLAIYLNGIMMFLSSLLGGLLISFIMIGAKGIFDWTLLGRMLLIALMNLLMFMGAYNLSILAVMLTGNVIIAGIMSVICLFYFDIWTYLIRTYREYFYNTLLLSYQTNTSGISIYKIYSIAVNQMAKLHSATPYVLQTAGIAAIKLVIWIVLPLIWSYRAYVKRPAESAGSSVAFYSSRVLIKLMISVPAGLFLCGWVYMITELSLPIAVSMLVVGTILAALLTEVAFNYDLKSAFKHWGVIIAALFIVLSFFAVHYWDVFGYDRYIPAKDKLVSYAVMNSAEAFYTDAINFDADTDDYMSSYIDSYQFAADNMYLTDTEAILALANKSIGLSEEERQNCLVLGVYYRLKNGTTRSRTIWVNPYDEDNSIYLNRIVGPAYYKQGVWQAMSTDIPKGRVSGVTYFSPSLELELSKADAQKLVEGWREDMSTYDYNLIRYQAEEGYIQVSFDNYSCWNLPVYSCFAKTKDYLSKQEDYKYAQIAPEAVSSISITYYPMSANGEYYMNPETYEFSDSTTIERIMQDCDSYPTHSGWMPDYRFSTDYTVQIMIKPEYINIYNNYTFYSYGLLNDKLGELKEAELLP